jgi:hypothetical protein
MEVRVMIDRYAKFATEHLAVAAAPRCAHAARHPQDTGRCHPGLPHRASHRARLVSQQAEAQIHVQSAPVLVNRAGGQNTVPILGPAGVDRPVKTLPVRGSKSFRNDHIETLAQNFGCGITEDSLSPAVPDLDRSVATGDDDGVGSLLDDRLKQVEIRRLELSSWLHFQSPWQERGQIGRGHGPCNDRSSAR